jgi:hypothetical protein
MKKFFLFSFLIVILNLTLSHEEVKADHTQPPLSTEACSDSGSGKQQETVEQQILKIYASLSASTRPAYEVFRKGMVGYINLRSKNAIQKQDIITIIDYSLSSVQKRLWVIDLKNSKVLWNTLVAHGRNTGETYAKNFSNVSESLMSSLGFFVTGNIYNGSNGMSMILKGLEKGFNDNAMARAIVMHGADYVSGSFIKKTGRIGRSWGCPSIPQEVRDGIINTIANGTCLFIYYPDKKYLSSSPVLSGSKQ